MDSVSTILATLIPAITAAGRQYFEATAGAIGPPLLHQPADLVRHGRDQRGFECLSISMRDAVQLSFRIVMSLMFGLTWSPHLRSMKPPATFKRARAGVFPPGGSGAGPCHGGDGYTEYDGRERGSRLQQCRPSCAVSLLRFSLCGLGASSWPSMYSLLASSKLMIAFLLGVSAARHRRHHFREDQGNIRGLGFQP